MTIYSVYRDSPEAPLSDTLLRSQEPSALEIAAEQMRLWQNIDTGKNEIINRILGLLNTN